MVPSSYINDLKEQILPQLKQLIDHLENNHSKLIDSIKFVEATILNRQNVPIHMTGLLIISEFAQNIDKFEYKNFLPRMVEDTQH